MSEKMNRRAFIGTALTFGALCAASPSSAMGITAAEKKAEVRAVNAKLQSLYSEMDEAVDKYNGATEAYNKATEKVEKCKAKINKAQSTIDSLQGHLSTRATSMYRSGSMSYLDVLLGVGSFDDFATVWDTLNNLNEEDAEMVTKTKQAKAELESAKKELKEQQAEAKTQLDAARAYNRQIENMVAEAENEYNSLNAEYKQLLREEQEAEQRRAAAAAAYTPATNTGSSNNGGGNSGGGNSGGGNSGGGSAASDIPTNGSVVDYARSRIGCPYVWAAEGPNAFDCSGLTKWCYAQIGKSLSHYTESQYAEAKARLSVYSASPGDVLYRSGHVGIYSGGDSYIHAPHTGAYVSEVSGIGSFSAALRF